MRSVRRKRLGGFLSAILLTLLFLLPIGALRADDMGALQITVAFEGNWLFDKYDVELYIDDLKVADISHGKDYEGVVDIAPGSHTLIFYKAKDHSVEEKEQIQTSEKMSLACKISVSKKEIHIDDLEIVDIAAEERQREEEESKAAAEKKRKEEESKAAAASRAAEESKLAAELADAKDAFEKILTIEDPYAKEIQTFANDFIGKKVQFKGNLAYIVDHGETQTYLFHAGKYDAKAIIGPDFQISNVSPAVLNCSRKPRVGNYYKITASIAGYETGTHVIELIPEELQYLSSAAAKTFAASDFTYSENVKRIQNALNHYGYECGTADGIAGKRTNQAIADYKAARDLEGGSAIDAALVVYLRVSMEKAPKVTTVKKEASTKSETVSTHVATQSS